MLNLGGVANITFIDGENDPIACDTGPANAVIDGFNDSDFGSPLTGTNLKGYTVGASMALSPRVKFGVRWMGANNIDDPAYKSDLLQLDLTAKF